MIMVSDSYSVLLPQEASTPHITERKIEGFKNLGDGWHFGEGVPFTDIVLENAKTINRQALNLAFFETDAFPGANGEVMVTIYHHDHYLEFTIDPDGSITFVREQDNEEVASQEGVTVKQAKVIISDFRKEIWKESDFSTANIMTTEDADSLVSRLRTQGNLQASLLSAIGVSLSQGTKFAVISEDITTSQWSVNPQSFGGSTPRIYQTATS